jgi:hypothetical protein
MAKIKNKVPAPAVGRNKKIIPQAKPVSLKHLSPKPVSQSQSKSAHARLQRVYQENGFIGSPDQRRIDLPVSHYRNHPALIAAVIILIIILAGALAYIFLSPVIMASRINDAEKNTETEQSAGAGTNQILDTTVTEDAASPAGDSLPPVVANNSGTAWLDYRDTKGAFEFKYAPTWQADQQDLQRVNFSLSEFPETVITADWQATSTSLNAYLLALDKANAKGWEGQPSVAIERQGNVKIGTLNAYQRWQKLLAADLEEIATYAFVGNKVYVLSIRSPKLTDQIIQAYGSFLATFKLGVSASTTASSTPKIK